MTTAEEITIRTYNDGSKIKLCKHIEVYGQIEGQGSGEYTEQVILFCQVCNKDIGFCIEVN